MIMEDSINDNLKFCECGCGEYINKFDNRGRSRNYVNRHFCRGKKGRNAVSWKGGRRFHKHSGYILLNKPEYFSCGKDGWIAEHIFIFQEYYNCCLLDWGVVHHKNRIKIDNRIENLDGMMNSQHSRLHREIDTSSRICMLCDSNKTFIKKTGKPLWLKHEDGFICINCYMKIYRRKKKYSQTLSSLGTKS